ncbi:hypothetical protein LBW62_23450 [Ralstonia solanacearum]|nr:hypothetical protein [Ralstonia solanacearum]MDB0544208.1 hypothetical protein [Ralstonia solanacearum]MDB0554011.1 hypothetical protein [Ralstonia solanacearum]MDB0559131.1 hypothetical protein [Ralstonia solanacearum]QTY25290.1 hypothetical protein CDC46_28330 [Ralstonia solanacearum]
MPTWSFKQALSVRASTMLLICVPLLCALDQAASLLPGQISPSVQLFARATDPAGIVLIAAVFGLGFFVASCIRKNPQIQYFIEFAVALTYLILMPAY